MIDTTLRIAIRDDADRNAGSIELVAREYTAQLIDNLGLPAKAVVSIELGSGLSDDCFSLTIAGQAPIEVCATVRTIDAEIPLAIYRNRRSFISDDVVAAYAGERSPDTPPAKETLEKVRQLMLAAAERNVSLSRAKDRIPADLAALNVYEVTSKIHTDDAVTVAVAGAIGEAANAWETLQRLVFDRTGLLCPIPVSMDGRQLGSDEYQVRINDVYLPVQNVAEKLMPFIEQSLVESRLALVTCDSLRRRVELVEAPVLSRLIDSRVGTERLWTDATSMVRRDVPLRDFRALLERIVLDMARFGDEPAA